MVNVNFITRSKTFKLYFTRFTTILEPKPKFARIANALHSSLSGHNNYPIGCPNYFPFGFVRLCSNSDGGFLPPFHFNGGGEG